MFRDIDENIKRIIKVLSIVSIITFILGLVKMNIVVLSLSFGIFISIISNLMLLYTVHKIVYLKGNRATMFIDSTKRYGIYILALYFVYKISIRFFNVDPVYPILSCGFGFLSFRLMLQGINFLKF
ncbi:hypothetical protein [Streptobacillus canis]|uniref:hypothetical protein n=1 Tax=Streptobacillus canis TaxID=2678686 RepID=UPI0012E15BBB|nr:hypothetical protein [Streptobacillus canis]